MLSNLSVNFVNMTSNEECCVCLKNIQGKGYGHEINERVAHVFHENCINQCLKQRACCPQCNAEVFNYQDVGEGAQLISSIVNLLNNSFVVTWLSQSSSEFRVHGQILNAEGTMRGKEYHIDFSSDKAVLGPLPLWQIKTIPEFVT